MTRPFRFGVVAPVLTDLPTWRDRVRRIADSGYSTLLMPDVLQWQPAPAPTLAIAAALTDLRVGTWVYASPLRPAWSTAWEAHPMSLLTEGRFEMGIGTGRPGIEDELRELGMPVSPPRERLAQVRETVATLRDLDGPDVHTPVVMAIRGPNAQALAVEVADTSRSQRLRAILAPTSAVWQGTSVPCGTSSSRSTSQSSATTSRRS
jgi:alkanesulfonate monooxygenase SsuD/methylene tetrahydromethanopterin reductase-like flavin-dependent oxidoreductase (luciferase family)